MGITFGSNPIVYTCHVCGKGILKHVYEGYDRCPYCGTLFSKHPYSDYSLTAKEAITKIRRGESLEDKEYDNMKVGEQIKFTDMLYDEGRVGDTTKRANEELKKYIKTGVIKPDDTGKEAERKIDTWLSRPPAG